MREKEAIKGIRLVQEGYTMKDAAATVGIAISTLRKYMRIYGIDTPSQIKRKQIERALELVASGMPRAQAAKEAGIMRETIRTAERRLGLPPAKERWRRYLSDAHTDDPTLSKVLSLARRGLTNREIAKEMGIAHNTVSGYLRKIVRGERLHRRSKPAFDITKEPLLKWPRLLQAVELVRKGYSYSEAAEVMGVKRRTAYHYVYLAYHPQLVKAKGKSERRRLIKVVNNLRPTTRQAIMKVFGDILKVEP